MLQPQPPSLELSVGTSSEPSVAPPRSPTSSLAPSSSVPPPSSSGPASPPSGAASAAPASIVIVEHIGDDGGNVPSMHVAAPVSTPGIVTMTRAVSPSAVSSNVAPLEGSVQTAPTVVNGSWIS
jgi:hypothetical protein